MSYIATYLIPKPLKAKRLVSLHECSERQRNSYLIFYSLQDHQLSLKQFTKDHQPDPMRKDLLQVNLASLMMTEQHHDAMTVTEYHVINTIAC